MLCGWHGDGRSSPGRLGIWLGGFWGIKCWCQLRASLKKQTGGVEVQAEPAVPGFVGALAFWKLLLFLFWFPRLKLGGERYELLLWAAGLGLKAMLKIWPMTPVQNPDNRSSCSGWSPVLFCYWKGSLIAGESVRRFASSGSLPQRTQWPELNGSRARSLFGMSHTGAASQGFGLSLTDSLAHRKGTEWEVGLP